MSEYKLTPDDEKFAAEMAEKLSQIMGNECAMRTYTDLIDATIAKIPNDIGLRVAKDNVIGVALLAAAVLDAYNAFNVDRSIGKLMIGAIISRAFLYGIAIGRDLDADVPQAFKEG
jgi:hypothetical protein